MACSNGNRFEVLGDALKLDCHLSFPFIFEHGGDVFMMPEMSARRRVEIYRAVNFPLHLDAACDRLAMAARSPILFCSKIDGHWWLFANISETPFEDHCNELHVFAVDGPALQAHRAPSAQSGCCWRGHGPAMAGALCVTGERLLRIAQRNTDGIYGRGLQIMEITRLDSDGYEERVVEQFDHTMQRGLIGLHHLDRCAGAFIFDGCRKFG